MTDSHPTITLAGGVEIPQIGLGVFRTPPGPTAVNAMTAALETGYRHIDTAAIYGNEADVGHAIAKSGVPRREVFITTKLWNDDHGYDNTLRAFHRSASALGVDVIDLYLIHFPVPEFRLDTWRALETLHRDGRARAIGVSNYQVRHLDELAANSPTTPAVNQIELSPFNYRTRLDIINRCGELGTHIEAYSPLTKAQRLNHPVVAAIAVTHQVTPAQILIRYQIDKGHIVIPKSTNPDRIATNADVFGFNLTTADLDRLDALDEALVTGWTSDNTP